MRKIIHQKQNPTKALEVRLENGEPDKYLVIVAGLTIINPDVVNKGVTEPTNPGEYLFVENDTYFEYQLKTYHEAKKLFDSYTIRFLSL
ncbi:MAG: hypothetical protein U0T74_01260 [Chitinophagales bacterium]